MATRHATTSDADEQSTNQGKTEIDLPIRWKKWDVVAKAFAGIAIPAALAWFGHVQQQAQRDATAAQVESELAQREADRIVALRDGLASSDERERLVSLLTVDVLTRTGSIPEEFQAAIIGAALFGEEGPSQQLAERMLEDRTKAGSISAEAQASVIQVALSTGGAPQSKAAELLRDRADYSISTSTPPDAAGPPDSLDIAGRRTDIDRTIEEFVDPAAVRRLRSQTVLWVDDRPSNNRALRTTLVSAGLVIDTVTSTETALQAFDDRVYDLVISDMGRPESTTAGYELLDSIRARRIGTPLIIYSLSRDIERHNAEAQAHGAVGQATTPEQLLRLVRSALDLPTGR